jgi:hypothetical protein
MWRSVDEQSVASRDEENRKGERQKKRSKANNHIKNIQEEIERQRVGYDWEMDMDCEADDRL